MQVTTNKTVKTLVTVTWDASIDDDSGKQIARMTGTLDANRPLGSTNLTIGNNRLYEENAEAVKKAYEDFQALVKAAAENGEAAGSSKTEALE